MRSGSTESTQKHLLTGPCAKKTQSFFDPRLNFRAQGPTTIGYILYIQEIYHIYMKYGWQSHQHVKNSISNSKTQFAISIQFQSYPLMDFSSNPKPPGSSKYVKFLPSPKKIPKGRTFRYLEDPGVLATYTPPTPKINISPEKGPF